MIATIKYIRIVLFFIPMCATTLVYGQLPLLTLDEAIAIASQNNGNVATSQLNAQAASMQVYNGNVGLLPRIDWNTNLNASSSYVNLEFIDGRVLDRLGRTFSPNSNVNLSWLMYDGNQRNFRLNILKQQSEIASLQLQSVMDQIRYATTQSYLSLAHQKATINYLNTIIKYYEERLKITEERWKIGKGSKLDFLQSQNDINSQKSELQNAELIYQNQKVLLNLLLNRDANTNFDIEESAEFNDFYTYDDILAKALANDEELLAMEKSIQVSKLHVEELKANLKPRIGINTSFGYNFTNSNAGQILLNQNLGLNAGISATWNLYDGKHNKTQVDIAKLGTTIVAKEKEIALQSLKSQITIAINQLNSYKKTLLLEAENRKIADENLTIALEKFRLGASTILELNDAQQRFDLALNRYVNSVYQVKFAELEVNKFTF